ncbi:MAG TPA: hypothetical protein PKK26_14685 [Candidatus Wallbacteria bacterium]|nr:hypothetical protein [Candidatus Wallbacteria bacterium]
MDFSGDAKLVKLNNKKGFSIPLVVSLALFLAIITYALQVFTAQSAKNIHYTVDLKKAEYIAEAGLKRAASFIGATAFESRIYKNVASFSFGYTNNYSENYGDGKYNVTIVDIPAIISNFGIDLRPCEYQGVFLWASGSYRNATRFILARYIPSAGTLPIFKYKKTINSNEEYEYFNIEIN